MRARVIPCGRLCQTDCELGPDFRVLGSLAYSALITSKCDLCHCQPVTAPEQYLDSASDSFPVSLSARRKNRNFEAVTV